MSYTDAIDYLYGLQKYGIKLGLDKTRTILSRLGNPHKDFSSIHIAGTNGKGSVSAMTASILTSHCFKVGLFTSPHLVSFTERIRINNEQILESEVVRLTDEIREKLEGSDIIPTFFEFVTAMAFLYFSRNGIDWAVIETGMGGRLDATNVITPEVSVIARISYDHKDFLGETLKDIAKEKAGIIKKGIPVVSAFQQKEAEDVLETTAKDQSAPFFVYGKDFKGVLISSDLDGIIFDYIDSEPQTPNSELTNLFVPLAGEHQLFNACIAIKAATLAIQKAAEQQSSRAVEKNFHSVTSVLSRFRASALKDGLAGTEWRGRLEIVNDDPMIMIDGAHNPDAAAALSDFIKKHLSDYKIILIMGVMSDKDITGILSPLLPLASGIIFTAPNYGRAASPQELAERASKMGYDSAIADSVKEAIETAINRAEEQKSGRSEGKTSELPSFRASMLILITGSFYTIGEAMEMLGEKPILAGLRETV
ncbi:MAG: bifunctional folylpolyglutamate synthase/dihydrofolate synthase [Nitrospirae bacterium]|nr:bifunctional folylpolyglutamate synthase/dihydrofolate synthase [Nitrospirota bacterium]MCL5977083.1 bifunctional folylpolyglutamate synthase/dihydrofolate synthase [Nitrospirota bacterium]